MTMPFHTCSGSECPYCGVYAVGRQAVASPRLSSAVAHDDASAYRPFMDSRGFPVRQMPTRLAPSTTVIIPRGTDWQAGAPWDVVVHQRTDNGWWGFPGGEMNIGESVLDCARREALEETGLTVHIERFVCMDSDPRLYGICVYPNGDCVQYANVTLLATIRSGTLVSSPESLQVCWASTDCLPRPFLPGHLWRIAQAMAGVKRVEGV